MITIGRQLYLGVHRYPICLSSFSTSAPRLVKKKMPPKKAAPAEKKTLLGRPSNNLKIGIVGLFRILPPSTPSHLHLHFRAPQRRQILLLQCPLRDRCVPSTPSNLHLLTPPFPDLGKAANFPYATINPEEARIPVPDARFEWLCDVYKPASRVPAFLTCIDIAGLTAGASTGAGLGNAFLSHVRSVDGIFQVVRAFDDAEVIHVEGDVNPLRDMEIIQTELRLKDIEWVEKHLDGLKKSGRNLNSTSLADKAKKEEIVSAAFYFSMPAFLANLCRLSSRRSSRPSPSMPRMSARLTGPTKK